MSHRTDRLPGGKIDDAPLDIFIVLVAVLEHIEVRPDIRCAKHNLFAHLNGQLRFQFLFVF